MVLQSEGEAFRILLSTTVTQIPIRKLTTSSLGMADLGVDVTGGGRVIDHEARLRWNGTKYSPSNPSIAPVCRRCAGTTLIDETTPKQKLHP